ncbi:glycosyltransferase family 2 protein [Roseococcus sp. DSY-14]|uniref:glycosyltransferase family 2 protein n=1 Tax=Roseococcus sp. DSY-14 TaxID=3369650 RepID=UPI00387A83ED
MTPPAVSVCIPSYNHAAYVREAIGSVLSQEVPGGLEVVVTDDASTDGTPEVIESIGDPRIRLFRSPRNRGPSVTANHNVQQARGEFVALLPSDDMFEPGKLARQLEVLRARPEVAAVFSHMRYVDERGAPLAREPAALALPRGVTRERALRTFLLEGNCFAAPTAMLRRREMLALGGFDARLLQTQDFDFWIRLCLRHEVAMVEEPLVAYRIRDAQANMDANTPAKAARLHWELPRILEHYLGCDAALLRAAFPETAAHLDAGLSPASAVGLLALAQPHPWMRAFGVEALYRGLGDAAEAARLEAAGWGNPAFFRVLAEVDPSGTARLQAAEQRHAAREHELADYLRQVEEARDWFRIQAERWEAAARGVAQP